SAWSLHVLSVQRGFSPGSPASSHTGGATSNLNMNLYATKKTAAEGMLDIALFLANITHMKTVIEQGAGYRYYAAVLTLISFSLALQIVAGVLIIIIGELYKIKVNQKRLDSLNNMTTIIIFLIFVTNIFISVFGMELDLLPQRQNGGQADLSLNSL
uniref:Ninjurin 2 n=1 Tax=Stegastes partitus TaxID=144197 RepID=A0A3B4ZE49_9TELE